MAFRIARALRVPLEKLLTGEDTPRKYYADTVFNDLGGYLETKDHESLVRIKAIIRTAELVDLVEMVLEGSCRQGFRSHDRLDSKGSEGWRRFPIGASCD